MNSTLRRTLLRYLSSDEAIAALLADLREAGFVVRETGAPSVAYRAAIYFGVATLHFYRDDILPLTPQQTLGDFADANQAVVDQMVEECRTYLHYDLSHEQIGCVIQAYLAASCSKIAAAHDTPEPTT